MVQWLTDLDPTVIKLIVGVPYTGGQLASMLSSQSFSVRKDDDHGRYQVGYRSRTLPSDLPIRIRYLLKRLSRQCHQDLTNMIIALPPRFIQALSAIIEIAPPRVIQCLVDMLDCFGRLEVEDFPAYDPDEPIWVSPLYDGMDEFGGMLPFLLKFSDDALASIWPGPNAAFKLVQQIARCDLVIDLRAARNGNYETSLNHDSPFTVAASGTYRLDVGTPDVSVQCARSRTATEIKKVIRSLRVAQNDMQFLADPECSICSSVYGEKDPENGKSERAATLPCGHVFGENCLIALLKPKKRGGYEQHFCPMCRARITMCIIDPSH